MKRSQKNFHLLFSKSARSIFKWCIEIFDIVSWIKHNLYILAILLNLYSSSISKLEPCWLCPGKNYNFFGRRENYHLCGSINERERSMWKHIFGVWITRDFLLDVIILYAKMMLKSDLFTWYKHIIYFAQKNQYCCSIINKNPFGENYLY